MYTYIHNLKCIHTNAYMYKYTYIHAIYIENCDQCEYQEKYCLNLFKCVYSKAFSYVLLSHHPYPESSPSMEVAQRKYITFRVQYLLSQRYCLLLMCYFEDSGELPQAPIIYYLCCEQPAHLCTRPSPWNTQDWSGGWAIPFPDWPHVRRSVSPVKCEKSPGGVNVTCAGKGEKQPAEV